MARVSHSAQWLFSWYKPDYYQQKELTFRHLNIDLSTVLNDHHFGSEPFEIKQNGKVVCRSELSENETERVFGLIEEEVELVFPHLDLEPITLKTPLSPQSWSGNQRKPMGATATYLPYNSKVRWFVVFVLSEQALSKDQVMALEADPALCAIPFSELSHYSESRFFDQETRFYVCRIRRKAQVEAHCLTRNIKPILQGLICLIPVD